MGDGMDFEILPSVNVEVRQFAGWDDPACTHQRPRRGRIRCCSVDRWRVVAFGHSPFCSTGMKRKKRVNMEERVGIGQDETDYDPFMKCFGGFLVGLVFWMFPFWGRTAFRGWFPCSVETGKEEGKMRRKERETNERKFVTLLAPAGCAPSSGSPRRRVVPTDRGFLVFQQRACSSSPPRQTRSSQTTWDSSCFVLADRRSRSRRVSEDNRKKCRLA